MHSSSKFFSPACAGATDYYSPPEYFSSIVDYPCFPKTSFSQKSPFNFLSQTPPKWARYGYCMQFSIFPQTSRACTGAEYNHSYIEILHNVFILCLTLYVIHLCNFYTHHLWIHSPLKWHLFQICNPPIFCLTRPQTGLGIHVKFLYFILNSA